MRKFVPNKEFDKHVGVKHIIFKGQKGIYAFTDGTKMDCVLSLREFLNLRVYNGYYLEEKRDYSIII